MFITNNYKNQHALIENRKSFNSQLEKHTKETNLTTQNVINLNSLKDLVIVCKQQIHQQKSQRQLKASNRQLNYCICSLNNYTTPYPNKTWYFNYSNEEFVVVSHREINGKQIKKPNTLT